MASVSKRERLRADGTNGDKWICRWLDDTGAHRQKAFDRKKEADAWRQKVEADAAAYQHSGGFRDVTVREAVNLYEAHNDRREADGQIKRTYRAHLDTVMRVSVLPTLGKRRLSEVDAHALARWVADLRDGGLSARTATDRLIHYSGLWKFAKRNKLARGENPVSEALQHVGRIPKPKIRQLTPTQVTDILRAASARRARQRPKSWQITQIVVNLGAFAGLRLGEIMGLRLSDIDIDRRRIHVRHTLNRWDELTPPKRPSSVRVVPVPEHVISLLAAWIATGYMENDRQIVLRTDGKDCSGWRGRTVDRFNRQCWRPLCVAAGVETKEETDHFHFHALRHFAGSWWLRHRLPVTEVSRLLGHADPGITMRIYAHEIMEDAERVAAIDTMSSALMAHGHAQELRTGQKMLEYQA